jgi:hypothetical protein
MAHQLHLRAFCIRGKKNIGSLAVKRDAEGSTPARATRTQSFRRYTELGSR